MVNSSATSFGYVHANSSNYIGFLNNSGTWIFQARSNGNLYKGDGTGLIWHAANDGAGSGLDADNLDGVTWSNYKSTGHTQLNVQAGNNYGLRFWNGSDSYKINMSSSSAGGRMEVVQIIICISKCQGEQTEDLFGKTALIKLWELMEQVI